MRLFAFTLVFLSGLAGAQALFGAQAVSVGELRAEEKLRYEKVSKGRGVLRSKLVFVDPAALSRQSLSMDFFGGEREQFQVKQVAGEKAWKGRGPKNFDRFVIRENDGKFSGYVLHNERQYVLTPLTRNISLVYEITNDQECGADSKRLEARKIK